MKFKVVAADRPKSLTFGTIKDVLSHCPMPIEMHLPPKIQPLNFGLGTQTTIDIEYLRPVKTQARLEGGKFVIFFDTNEDPAVLDYFKNQGWEVDSHRDGYTIKSPTVQ